MILKSDGIFAKHTCVAPVFLTALLSISWRRGESNDTRLLILRNLFETYERKNRTTRCMPASYVQNHVQRNRSLRRCSSTQGLERCIFSQFDSGARIAPRMRVPLSAFSWRRLGSSAGRVQPVKHDKGNHEQCQAGCASLRTDRTPRRPVWSVEAGVE